MYFLIKNIFYRNFILSSLLPLPLLLSPLSYPLLQLTISLSYSILPPLHSYFLVLPLTFSPPPSYYILPFLSPSHSHTTPHHLLFSPPSYHISSPPLIIFPLISPSNPSLFTIVTIPSLFTLVSIPSLFTIVSISYTFPSSPSPSPPPLSISY